MNVQNVNSSMITVVLNLHAVFTSIHSIFFNFKTNTSVVKYVMIVCTDIQEAFGLHQKIHVYNQIVNHVL